MAAVVGMYKVWSTSNTCGAFFFSANFRFSCVLAPDSNSQLQAGIAD